MILTRHEHSRLAVSHIIPCYVINAECENHCITTFPRRISGKPKFTIANTCGIMSNANHCRNYLRQCTYSTLECICSTFPNLKNQTADSERGLSYSVLNKQMRKQNRNAQAKRTDEKLMPPHTLS